MCNIIVVFILLHKGIVQAKKLIWWKCTHPQAIQDANSFFLYQNRFWEIVLHHSEWVPIKISIKKHIFQARPASAYAPVAAADLLKRGS